MNKDKSDPLLPKQFVVQKVQRETHDTFTLELERANGNGGFKFAPGQFNMLYVFGTGEVPISISGNPVESDTVTHTTRIVGAVTKNMGKLKVGDILGIRGPYGTHWPVEDFEGEDVVIVAGGIGLAPLRPAVYYILANRKKYGKITLLYGTRTKEDILYRKQLEQWSARLDMEVYVTLDRGAGDWRGNVGVVTTLIPRAPFDHRNAKAIVCGPEIMMRFTIQELMKRGLPEKNIYLSMERNMKCGVGLCGRCQYGPHFICKDGPVFRYDKIMKLLDKGEV